MKRFLALLIVLVLGVTLLALVGCGSGDTKQAQTDLKQADADYAALTKQLSSLQTMLTTAIGGAMSGNFSAITPTSLQQADQIITTSLDQIPKVKAEYAKVDSLSGVQDYKDYADAMQKVLSAQEDAIKSGKQLIDSLMPVAASGNPAQIQQWFAANQAALTQAQSTQAAVDKAYNEAQSIKSEKNLKY